MTEITYYLLAQLRIHGHPDAARLNSVHKTLLAISQNRYLAGEPGTDYILAPLLVHAGGVTLEPLVIADERMPAGRPAGTVWAEIQQVKSASRGLARETLANLKDLISAGGISLEGFIISDERQPRYSPPGMVWAEVQTVLSTSHDLAKETLRHYLDIYVSTISHHAHYPSPHVVNP